MHAFGGDVYAFLWSIYLGMELQGRTNAEKLRIQSSRNMSIILDSEEKG